MEAIDPEWDEDRVPICSLGKCRRRQSSAPTECEECWNAAMDDVRERDEAARDRENDRRIDEARGK